FSKSEAILLTFKISATKTPTRSSVTVTAPTEASDIQRLRQMDVKLSRRCRIHVLIAIIVTSSSVTDDAPFFNANDTMTHAVDHFTIMRRHNNRRALRINRFKHLHDLPRCRRVQISRWLIRYNNFRLIDD